MKKRRLYLLVAFSLLIFLVGLILSSRNTIVQGAGSTILNATVPTTEEVYVPAGSFGMGCTHDLAPATCDKDAKPLRLVYLDAYYIDKVPVTNVQYAACEAAGACPAPLSTESKTRPDYYTNPKYNSYPMINVEWVHANAYCKWVGKRLPTEAEWEKAARGTDLRTFPWGEQLPNCELSNVGYFIPNDATSYGLPHLCVGDTVPVGSYPQNASPYGALDMVGNVRQLINDFYVKPYLLESPYFNPTGPEEDLGKGHVARGGGWYDYPRRATTWIRHDEAEVAAYETIGFRCAHPAGPGGTPTPIPPTPTPKPSAATNIGPEGGSVWLTYPEHMTLIHIPAGVVNEDTLFELIYDATNYRQEDYGGINHFFQFDATTDNQISEFDEPLEIVLGFDQTRAVKTNTIDLFQLQAGTWVTETITVTQKTLNSLEALITQTGTYGLMAKANWIFLPIITKFY